MTTQICTPKACISLIWLHILSRVTGSIGSPDFEPRRTSPDSFRTTRLYLTDGSTATGSCMAFRKQLRNGGVNSLVAQSLKNYRFGRQLLPRTNAGSKYASIRALSAGSVSCFELLRRCDTSKSGPCGVLWLLNSQKCRKLGSPLA